MKAEDIRPSHLNPYDPQYDPLVARNPDMAPATLRPTG
jgi:hypothetical protein